MPIRRKHKPHTSEPRDAHNPVDPSLGGSKGSPIWAIATFLRNVFSYKGSFWMGVTIFLIAFIYNWLFYFNLLLQRGGMGDWQSAGIATVISSFTTLFEMIPVVMTVGYQNRLHEIFREASKPTTLPVLNKKTTNANDLLEAYRNADRDTRDFFKFMRWAAIGFEIFVGLAFIGAVGAGFSAALALILFAASIFGCEVGLTMALRSANWELPPGIRKQYDELIESAQRQLKLSEL